MTPAAKRLLIVEDSDVLREVLGEVVVDMGHQVVAVGDGASALTALTETAFDFVLIDLNLPDMQGVDVIRAFDARAEPLRPCFILMSGEGNAGDLPAGCDRRLSKPFDAESLEQIIAGWRAPRGHGT